MVRTLSAFFITLLIFWSCNLEEEHQITVVAESNYNTSKVIIVVIDGPRFIDTWGSTGKINIPYQMELATKGVFFDNFYNNGPTYTVSGHTAITTGGYEKVDNDGSELPDSPSIFQWFLAHTKKPPFKTSIITSKDKLKALANTKDHQWKGSFLPDVKCQDRADSKTLKVALATLTNEQPELALIQFKGPDSNGHDNNWDGYLQAIRNTDRYVADLWQYIQENPFYKDKTTLLVTNDHGRHLDGIANGFVEHGDRCEGCRHISLLAIGPDFNQGQVVSAFYEQVDIAPTIATLLNFPWKGQGKPIKELLNP